MAISSATASSLQAWMDTMHAAGRVVTRMPATVNATLAGQLASRLATPDPSLGVGPAQWDYELAPFWLRVADNANDLSEQFVIGYERGTDIADDVLGAVASGTGDVVHTIVSDTGAAVAGALGVPAWALYGGVALAAWWLVTHWDTATQHVARARTFAGAWR